MADFLDEVELDLKEENFNKLIKKILPYLIGIGIFIILATSFYVWYDYSKITLQEKLSDQYYAATHNLESEKVVVQLEKLLNESGAENYAAMAGFEAASRLININKIKEALNIYQQISQNSKFDIIYRDLAILLYVSYGYSKSSDINLWLNKLESLTKENNPWQYNALELKASILIDNGKIEEAKSILLNLTTNNSVPIAIQKNAKALLSINWKNYE